MTSRSKEKMAAAFRKLFRSSDKMSEGEGSGSTNAQAKSNGSPARRLLSRHRDIVTPADPDTPGASRIKKTEDSISQKAVRSRRLMKELTDIQRNERKDNPIFTVSYVLSNKDKRTSYFKSGFFKQGNSIRFYLNQKSEVHIKPKYTKQIASLSD